MAVNYINTNKNSQPNKAVSTTTWKAKLWRWFWKGTLYFFGITLLWVTVLKFLPVWFTPYMMNQKIEAWVDGRSGKVYSDWTSMRRMSKEAPLSVIAAEDQLFPQHWGFDFKAMNNAFRYNWRGKKIRGASTISQQVAKNVFLWQGRSYFRKALEAYFTMLIEVIWGKERILEVYLNVAETAPMTFGYEAAAQQFFGKSSENLSRAEAARIAAVLPSPKRFSGKNPSAYTQRRTQQISRQMQRLGKSYLALL